MTRNAEHYASKVPEVTLGFWIIKILATTLGETGGDTVTMTWLKADVMVNSGYLVGSAIFLSVLIVLVGIQIATKKFHPYPLLGRHRGLNDRRHGHGRFCNALFGYRLHRGITAAVRVSHGRTRLVVLVAGFNFGGDRQYAKGRSLLLGGYYTFSDLGNRARRLGR